MEGKCKQKVMRYQAYNYMDKKSCVTYDYYLCIRIHFNAYNYYYVVVVYEICLTQFWVVFFVRIAINGRSQAWIGKSQNGIFRKAFRI